MKLKATVSWSAEVEVNVPENASEWEKRDAYLRSGRGAVARAVSSDYGV